MDDDEGAMKPLSSLLEEGIITFPFPFLLICFLVVNAHVTVICRGNTYLLYEPFLREKIISASEGTILMFAHFI